MKWKEAVNLSCFCTAVQKETRGGANADYHAAAMFADEALINQSSVVWFLTWREFDGLSSNIRSGAAFVLYIPVAEAKGIDLPDDVNLAVFRSKKNFLQCYRELFSEFIAIQDLHEQINELLTLVAANRGLTAITNKIAEMYNAPATVIDSSFSVLAASDNIPETAGFIRDDIKRGFLDIRVQNRLMSSEIVNPRSKRIQTAYFDTEVSELPIFRNYLTLIYQGNTPIGSFSIFDLGVVIPEGRLALLPIIAQILGLEIQKGDFYDLNKTTQATHLLTQLLDTELKIDEEIFRERLSIFGYSLEKYKYVVFVDLGDEYMEVTQLQSLAGEFRLKIKNSLYCIRDGGILYLTSRRGSSFFAEEELEEWRHIIGSMKIRLGVSGVFEELPQFSTGVNQAKRVISIGLKLEPENPIYCFDEYRLADVVAHMPDLTDLYQYCYPPLKRLIDSDEANGTKLVYTLYKYIEKPSKLSVICDELFIHKNTLYYRLDRIREIMQTDFRSADIIAQIQLTFQIFKYKNLFDQLVVRKE